MAPETPRAVSSRLLTMRFMQRAAASASSDGVKKRKLDDPTALGRINAQIDEALIKAALDNQEATRQAALEKQNSADTHWRLDKWSEVKGEGSATTQLNVVYVGYGDIDSSRESGETEDAPAKGRTSTRAKKKPDSKACLDPLTAWRDDSNDQSNEDAEAHGKRKIRHDSDDSEASSPKDRSHAQSRSRRFGGDGKAKGPGKETSKRITSISSAGSWKAQSGAKFSQARSNQKRR
ncbi:hypothetical protein CP532_4184 [Ophiocordyceps camponoti-leonardi (nom. inval.)]|nr:hypothetical protein CP532_4184 [Ophiocordyceps camponoti-leonardi (nom. inval.)]